MAATTWVLCDEDGNAVTEVSNASQRTFKAARNQGRQGAITLTHSDVEAQYLFEVLRNGVPQLRYYREDASGTKQLRLSASLTAINEDLSDDSDSLVAIFKDPFGRIFGDGSGDDPGRILLAPATFAAVDQGTIAWSLISTLNSASATGLRQGVIQATTVRDRDYETGKNVGEAITQLSEVLGGFDFEVLPLDPTAEGGYLGEFVVYKSMGSDRADLLWGYGPGTMSNVSKVSRQITPPINRVHMVTSDGLETIQSDVMSRARFGEWAISRSSPSDVTLQDTLDKQAEDALRPHWVKVVSFEPDSDEGPRPFDDFWLGDTGRFKAVEGAFEETFRPRVTSIAITEDEDGGEDYELETEVPLG